ncbi:hypothetical protein HYFRA_00003393 [Hymenoscyphus fraxineus]|uniref:CENP-V/GFA domain-containing protein n=1 Tax=Hymenoscyphus fraxineus TaxID=746836 RepID=A0A9N9KWD2_9HELO|nr:hypothetical protein HYFRA_00003393 [Hymenoscyphus fraxineus]
MEQGSCHCGQTAWEVKLIDKVHILCHCGVCQKLGGGPASLNQIVPKENFKLKKGNLKVYTYYGDSGKAVRCYFCPNCTSHAYHHQEIMGNNIVVRTMLLESARSMPPGAEIFGKARLPWVKEVAQTFDTMPPE